MFGRLTYKWRKFYDDDFDWKTYTADSYRRRVKQDIETAFLAIAEPGDLSFDAATGTLQAKGKSLHPNHTAILEAIGRLQPASVLEVGCGGGDHVANAAMVFPDIAVSGTDRGATQLELARKRHPHLAERFALQDATMPISRHWPRAEFVYTQAVIMHIHTAVSHFVALANLFHQSSQTVLLMENMQCHNFLDDIRGLMDGGHIPWDDLHMHRFEGSSGAAGLLLSRSALDLPMARDDAEFRAHVKPSPKRLKRADEDSARATFGAA